MFSVRTWSIYTCVVAGKKKIMDHATYSTFKLIVQLAQVDWLVSHNLVYSCNYFHVLRTTLDLKAFIKIDMLFYLVNKVFHPFHFNNHPFHIINHINFRHEILDIVLKVKNKRNVRVIHFYFRKQHH